MAKLQQKETSQMILDNNVMIVMSCKGFFVDSFFISISKKKENVKK